MGKLPFKARKHAGSKPGGSAPQNVDIFLRLDDIESVTAEVSASNKVPGSDLKTSPKSALTAFFVGLPKDEAALTSPRYAFRTTALVLMCILGSLVANLMLIQAWQLTARVCVRSSHSS
jgi:hypothetical protein